MLCISYYQDYIRDRDAIKRLRARRKEDNIFFADHDISDQILLLSLIQQTFVRIYASTNKTNSESALCRQISLLIEGHFLSLLFFPDGIHLFPNRPLPPIPLGNIAFCTEAVAALSALAIVVTREAPPLARSVGRRDSRFPRKEAPAFSGSPRSLRSSVRPLARPEGGRLQDRHFLNAISLQCSPYVSLFLP